MATKEWTFSIDRKQHVVVLEHGYWSGKRRVYLDEDLIYEGQRLLDTGDEIRFDIGYEECCVIIEPEYIKFNYALTINGVCLDTGKLRRKERNW